MEPIIIRNIIPHTPKISPMIPNIRVSMLPLRIESMSLLLIKKEPMSTGILATNPRDEMSMSVVPAPVAPHAANVEPQIEPRNADITPETSINIPPMREIINAPVASPDILKL